MVDLPVPRGPRRHQRHRDHHRVVHRQEARLLHARRRA